MLLLSEQFFWTRTCYSSSRTTRGKTTQTSIKATIVGTTKVISYKDIVKAQQKRDMKDIETIAVRGRRISKRNGSTPSKIIGKRTRSHEREEAMDKIRASGIEEYSSILKFSNS